MLKISLVAATVSFVVLGACGPSSPRDACNDVASTFCSKIYQCVDATVIKSSLGYADESDCVIKVEATANCANLVCPAGTSFESSKAGQCSDDIRNLACVNNLGFPTSCTPSAWCK